MASAPALACWRRHPPPPPPPPARETAAAFHAGKSDAARATAPLPYFGRRLGSRRASPSPPLPPPPAKHPAAEAEGEEDGAPPTAASDDLLNAPPPAVSLRLLGYSVMRCERLRLLSTATLATSVITSFSNALLMLRTVFRLQLMQVKSTMGCGASKRTTVVPVEELSTDTESPNKQSHIRRSSDVIAVQGDDIPAEELKDARAKAPPII
ncbi:Protein of unknown function, partial [Gryllus bimaculatus]